MRLAAASPERGVMCSPAFITDRCVLQGWAHWAKDEEGLTAQQRSMADVPWPQAEVYDRLELGGLEFTAAHLSANTKTKNSVVMARPYGSVPGITVPAQFGCVRRFYKLKPPSVADATGVEGQGMFTLAVACIDYFGNTGELTPGLNCPTVKKRFQSEVLGNLLVCTQLAATHITLAPCLHDEGKWQVLHHRDFDFMRKSYPAGSGGEVVEG